MGNKYQDKFERDMALAALLVTLGGVVFVGVYVYILLRALVGYINL